MFNKRYYEGLHHFERERKKEQDVRLTDSKILEWANRYTERDILVGHNKRALDIGCAYGYAMKMLRDLGYDVYGIDISRYAIYKAREYLDRKSCGASLIISDAQKLLPFRVGFDLIVSFEVLEHLINPVPFLRNVYETLGEGGVFIAKTPNRFAVYRLLLDHDPTHIGVKSYIEWKHILSFFRRTKIDCFTWVPSLGSSRLFLKLPLVGGGCYIFLEKL